MTVRRPVSAIGLGDAASATHESPGRHAYLDFATGNSRLAKEIHL